MFDATSMIITSLRRLFTLMFSLALVALAITSAKANTVSYAFTPIVYPDLNVSGNTDTVSGTIVVSSAGSIYGTWNSSNTASTPITITPDLTMSSAGSTSIAAVTVSESLNLDTLIAMGRFQRAGITIGPSAISLLNSSTSDVTQSGLITSLEVDQGSSYVVLENLDPYDSAGGGQQGYANVFASLTGNGASMQIEDTNADAYPYSSLPNPWIIATAVPVPEPASIALFAAAGLLAAVGRFARRRPAALRL